MKKLGLSLAATAIVFGLSAQVDRSKMPAPGPAPEIKLGETQSFQLDNGLKVFVVENSKLPRVSYSLVLDVDPFLEGDKMGYTEMAGQMMSTGTANRTKDQLNEEIDFIGANFSTSASRVSASSLTKHNEKLLDIMSDVVKSPKFSQEELDKLKKQAISGLAAEKDDPDAIANNVRRALIYGKDHPYGEVMTEANVENIELADVEQYYQTYFRPNIAYMAIVGDVDFKKQKALIEKYFGDWKKADVPTHSYEMPSKPQVSQIAFVNKPGAVQSVVAVGYPVELKPGSDNAIKSRVMNSILGGGFTSKLNLNLREANAYTYGARSSLSSDEHVGYFYASAKVRNEVTDSALVEMMKELTGMLNGSVTEDEVNTIKSYLTGTFAYSLENPATVARFAINKERYDLPEDYYANYLKNLKAVSKADVNEMAKTYITPANAHIIIVGNQKEVAEKLVKYSPTGALKYYDYKGDEAVATLRPAPEGVTAESVIDQYITALGGRKALEGVKSLEMKMATTMQGMPITISTFNASEKFAMKISSGPTVFERRVVNGDKALVSGMQGKQQVEGEELEKMKMDANIFPELDYKAIGSSIQLMGVDNVNDEDAYVVELKNKFGESQTDYYSVQTGLLVKSVSITETPNGAFSNEKLVEDYQDVNGVKFPFHILQSVGPQKMDLKVKEVKVNEKIDASEFATE